MSRNNILFGNSKCLALYDYLYVEVILLIGFSPFRSHAESNMNNNSSQDIHWAFSQVKGTLEDEFTDADLISCVEFNSDGKLLACGDKGGRIVIFQRANVRATFLLQLFFVLILCILCIGCSKVNKRIWPLLHISIARSGIWLFEITWNRREDQQNKLAQCGQKCRSLYAHHEW